MISPWDLQRADFTNQTASHDVFSLMTNIGRLIGLFVGPGLAVASPTSREWQLPTVQNPVIIASPGVGASIMSVAPAAELITAIKEGWRLNMTDLAEIMDVQRPTLYNWLNGKTAPNAETRQKLDLLMEAAPVWHRLTDTRSDSFLLDYTGPDEVGPSIRQRMKSSDCSLAELSTLIPQRIEQYQEARARSLALLGERPPTPTTAPSESARRMNSLWAENAKKLHRSRNRVD